MTKEQLKNEILALFCRGQPTEEQVDDLIIKAFTCYLDHNIDIPAYHVRALCQSTLNQDMNTKQNILRRISS